MPGMPTSASERFTPGWPASAGATATTLSEAGRSNGGMSIRTALTCTAGRVVVSIAHPGAASSIPATPAQAIRLPPAFRMVQHPSCSSSLAWDGTHRTRRSPATARMPTTSATSARVRRHPPDRVTDIVRDQQRTILVRCQPDRCAVQLRLVVRVEAGDDGLGQADRLAVLKGDEGDAVTAQWRAVPAAVLADECTAVILRRQGVVGGEQQPERGDMRAQR